MKENKLEVKSQPKLLSMKTQKERIDWCLENGYVYLGKGNYISKEDFNIVIKADCAMRYGDDLDLEEKE